MRIFLYMYMQISGGTHYCRCYSKYGRCMGPTKIFQLSVFWHSFVRRMSFLPMVVFMGCFILFFSLSTNSYKFHAPDKGAVCIGIAWHQHCLCIQLHLGIMYHTKQLIQCEQVFRFDLLLFFQNTSNELMVVCQQSCKTSAKDLDQQLTH